MRHSHARKVEVGSEDLAVVKIPLPKKGGSGTVPHSALADLAATGETPLLVVRHQHGDCVILPGDVVHAVWPFPDALSIDPEPRVALELHDRVPLNTLCEAMAIAGVEALVSASPSNHRPSVMLRVSDFPKVAGFLKDLGLELGDTDRLSGDAAGGPQLISMGSAATKIGVGLQPHELRHFSEQIVLAKKAKDAKGSSSSSSSGSKSSSRRRRRRKSRSRSRSQSKGKKKKKNKKKPKSSDQSSGRDGKKKHSRSRDRDREKNAKKDKGKDKDRGRDKDRDKGKDKKSSKENGKDRKKSRSNSKRKSPTRKKPARGGFDKREPENSSSLAVVPAGLGGMQLPGMSLAASLLVQSDPEVEAFLALNPVDQQAAARFRALPVDLQRTVLARGSLVGTRDPSAVLMSRVRDAMAGKPLGPPSGHPREPQQQDPSQQQPQLPGNLANPHVEAFLAEHNVDIQAANRLRTLPPSLQRMVLIRGGLSATRDASSVLNSRIRDAIAAGGVSVAMPP